MPSRHLRTVLIRDRTVSKDEAVGAALDMAVVDLADTLVASPRIAAALGLNQDGPRS
jgi:hypothetical protein